MRLIQLDRKYHYCWVWRFLFSWHHHNAWLGYYPDYETPRWWVEVTVNR